MNTRELPHFIIKNRFQKKPIHYSDILTNDILTDVCSRITGSSEYTTEFDETDYNKGRLAILEYQDTVSYISFSETEGKGRNSSFQSVPTALVKFYQDRRVNKKIYFYFLPSTGNIDTDYFIFMYRLMKTSGIEFLNDRNILDQEILPFISPEDIMANRNINRHHNRSNNSSYITRGANHVIQIYGKTYGANKYETTLMSIAVPRITANQVELYEICENELQILPKPCLDVIQEIGRVQVIPTDLTMERNEFNDNDSLRSPRYTFNLLDKLGQKKCAFCECEIPELIEGAHIWPVAEIKKVPGISIEEKINYAIDGENGLWLCDNHHKLFDEDYISIDHSGSISWAEEIETRHIEFITRITSVRNLESQTLTEQFLAYLDRRLGIAT